jgi:hypothetical protein
MELPKKIRKLRTPSPNYTYAVLSKETTKDWAKDTVLQKTFDNLQSAVDHVNKMTVDYIDDYDLIEEFGENIPTVSIADIPKNAFRYREPFQIINVKSPDDECQDPDEDGMWGNLRIYIQRLDKTA